MPILNYRLLMEHWRLLHHPNARGYFGNILNIDINIYTPVGQSDNDCSKELRSDIISELVSCLYRRFSSCAKSHCCTST